MIITLLVSCGKESGIIGDGNLSLNNGTPSNQIVSADSEKTSKGITFTSQGSWNAKVIDLNLDRSSENEVSWIKLDKYSGGPGTFTLNVTIKENYTGKNRRAEIKITTGSSSISVIIEQTVINENGEEHEVREPITIDDKEPWLKVNESDLNLLGAYGLYEGRYSLRFQTNLTNPRFRAENFQSEGEILEFMRFNGCNIESMPIEPEQISSIEYVADFEVFPNNTGKNRECTFEVFDQYEEQKVKTLKFVQMTGSYCEMTEVVAEPRQITISLKASKVDALKYYVSVDPFSDFGRYTDDKCQYVVLNEGQESVKLTTFEPVEPETEYYFHVQTQNTELGMEAEFDFKVISGQLTDEYDMVLSMIASRVNDYTLTLFKGADFKGTVDWGDGTIEKITEWKIQGYSHKYNVSAPTTFDIRLSGSWSYFDMDSDPALVAVKQWGDLQMKTVRLNCKNLKSIAPDLIGAFKTVENFGEDQYGGAFSGTAIESIPEGFFKYAQSAKTFDRVFEDCVNLKSIPENLFKGTNGVSYTRAFFGCKLLPSIPANIFEGCTEARNFSLLFYGCEGLTEIPAGLFDSSPNVYNFEGAFMKCINLTTIPSGLFANNKDVKYFGCMGSRDQHSPSGSAGLFEGCTSLTSIPSDLFAANTKAYDFTRIFKDCTSLTEIPENLFKNNVDLMSFRCAFEGCKNLNSIPVTLLDNNRKLFDCGSAFADCVSLTGESPYTMIQGNKVHLYERDKYPFEFAEITQYAACFNKATSLTDYDIMPQYWHF